MSQLRDIFREWGIEWFILTCYFFIWCQEHRILDVFFSYCQVLVINTALAQYVQTQRCESFVPTEKLFPSSLFVVFQLFQQATFLPSPFFFFFWKLATDQIKILQYDLTNPTAWILEGRERDMCMLACTHTRFISSHLFLRPYKSSFNKDCYPFCWFRAAGAEEPGSILLIIIWLDPNWKKLLPFELIVRKRSFIIMTGCFLTVFLTHSAELFKKKKKLIICHF